MPNAEPSVQQGDWEVAPGRGCWRPGGIWLQVRRVPRGYRLLPFENFNNRRSNPASAGLPEYHHAVILSMPAHTRTPLPVCYLPAFAGRPCSVLTRK